MANEGFHEAPDELSESTKELHRAITSLMEELEAVDWYQQRIDATKDEELAALLAHNRDEEMEHAAMLIEWLRKNNAQFHKQLDKYVFKDVRIV